MRESKARTSASRCISKETSAGYEVLTSETTGQRDGSTVGEASLRLFGTQPEVESLVRVISQHASHRN